MNPRVMIVLVTFYGDRHLDRLWSSLSALQYPPRCRQLLVVDNDPAHRAHRWFGIHAPGVRVIVPRENTGYAGGNALGMAEALKAGVDYVAVVTQDTDVEPAWLRELVEVAERHPRAGAVQPKILRRLDGGSAVIHSWGNELHFLGVGYVGGDGCPDRPLQVRPIGFASGAGVLYRAAALREVGLFDPVYFMYHEDSDLSWRMRLAGWEILLAPRAVMYHEYEFQRGVGKFFFMERNRLINLLTHYRLRTLLLLAPAMVLFEGLMLAHALRERWFLKRLAVDAFFVRPSTWRYLVQKRRQVRSIRRLPDAEVASHLAGRIEAGTVDTPAMRYLVNPLFSAYWWVARRLLAW